MKSKSCLFCAALLAVVLLPTPPAHALEPAPKCESAKLTEAGKYAFCRLKADSKAIKKGVPADYSKCFSKFSEKWDRAEAKAGSGICPSEGDDSSMAIRITGDAAEIATLLAGGSVPPCVGQQLPASGQMSVYGIGSDGDVQAGAPLAYADNGDGTILDLNTGLIWEKKDNSDSGGVHDVFRFYSWSAVGNLMDGSIKSQFLDVLNDVAGGGTSCFANYCDWRIPNYKELTSILDLEEVSPTVNPVFHEAGTCTGCSDVTLGACSCTDVSGYWSSTTAQDSPNSAWVVDFNQGGVLPSLKNSQRRARAVRGGS